MPHFLIATSAAKTLARVGDPLAFYEVAATIIPVLFLALVFQAGLFETRLADEDRPFLADIASYTTWRYIASGLFFVTGVGEVIALGVLIQQHANSVEQHAVVSALILLGLPVGLYPLFTIARAFERQAEKKEPAAAGPIKRVHRTSWGYVVIAVLALLTVWKVL